MVKVNEKRFALDGEALLAAMNLVGGVYACARQAKIEPTTIYKWCRHERTPRLEEWCRLMTVLEISTPFCCIG